MFVVCVFTREFVVRKWYPSRSISSYVLSFGRLYRSRSVEWGTRWRTRTSRPPVRSARRTCECLSGNKPDSHKDPAEISKFGSICIILWSILALYLPIEAGYAVASAPVETSPPAAPLEAAPYLKQGRPAETNSERLSLDRDSTVEHRAARDASGTLVPLDIIQLRGPTEPGSAPVQRRDAVLVRYVARLEDGTIIEDKRRNKAPVLFRAGTATLPAAVDLGVEGMRVGEERRIRVRARDNFHGVNLRLGAAATVPRDGVLFYDVELVGINPYS
ncbi:hypothetical protein CCYA_CCYA04G1190 [Cyanidiococcus yangmingshanensis]|nr:hypothetical protein CCYA_CCYA04G1190 [Cyanidiococcus yangmingshanensis]